MARPMQRLLGVAEEQWGLCTRAQALEAGVPPSSFARLVRDGLLERVAHGVYRVRGAGEPDHLELRAAWLQLDPLVPAWSRVRSPGVAVVSHASAASLYGVGDLRADIHEFTLGVRHQTRRRDVRIHRGTLPSDQVVMLSGLPATRAGRAVADLLGDHVEPASVAQIAVEVLERTLDRPGDLAEYVAPYAHRFGFRRADGVGLLEYLFELASHGESSTPLTAGTRGR